MLALAFSGGKDSLACWYLYREQKPHVIYVNTGKAYPETLEIVARVAAESEAFTEVETDQAGQIARNGVPADVVPIDWTALGFQVSGPKAVMVQSYLGCCYENVSRPLLDAAKRLGATRLIRGQRSEESHRSPAVHGSMVEGIEFLHPIENWTRDQVMAYLTVKGDVPAHFNLSHSSLDCYDCTAYRRESADRIEWMRERYPDFHAAYSVRQAALKQALAEAL